MQSSNEPLLNTTQVQALAEIVLEECGRNLDDADLDDQIGQLLEDIAGFETPPNSIVEDTIHSIRSRYYEFSNR